MILKVYDGNAILQRVDTSRTDPAIPDGTLHKIARRNGNARGLGLDDAPFGPTEISTGADCFAGQRSANRCVEVGPTWSSSNCRPGIVPVADCDWGH